MKQTVSSDTAEQAITGIRAAMRAFKDHPNSVGQNYYQHFLFSASISITLMYSSLTALVHAIAPPLCQTSTSKAINKLHARIQHQVNHNK